MAEGDQVKASKIFEIGFPLAIRLSEETAKWLGHHPSTPEVSVSLPLHIKLSEETHEVESVSLNRSATTVSFIVAKIGPTIPPGIPAEMMGTVSGQGDVSASDTSASSNATSDTILLTDDDDASGSQSLLFAHK